MYLPGILSRDAPYYLRVAGAWPIVTLAPAFAMDWCLARFDGTAWRPWIKGGVALVLIVQLVGSTLSYFVIWSRSPDGALKVGGGATAVAGYLRSSHPVGHIVVFTDEGTIISALAPSQADQVQWVRLDQFLPLPVDSAVNTYYLFDLSPPTYVYDAAHPYYAFDTVLSRLVPRVLDTPDPNARIPLAHGYIVRDVNLKGLLPTGPQASFDGRIAITGASLAADTTSPGVYQVRLGLRADSADLRGLVVTVRAVDGTGNVWAQSDVQQENTEGLLKGQQAVVLKKLSLYAGTPPGRLAVEVEVWDNQGRRSLPASGDAGVSLRIGSIQIPESVPVGPDHPAFPLQPARAELGGDLSVDGFHVSTFTPTQSDTVRLDLRWSCSRPLPAGTWLDTELIDPRGKFLASFTSGDGLATPPLDRCTPGQAVLDRRTLQIGPRWPPGGDTVRLEMRDAGGRVLAMTGLTTLTIAGLPRSNVTPPLERPIGAVWADGISLLGMSVTWSPDKSRLQLGLVWQSRGEPGRDYVVFTHLLNRDGLLIAQHDGRPARGAWPTTYWEPGQVVADDHTILAPGRGVGPGSMLEVGMYLPETGARLPIIQTGSARQEGDALRVPLMLEPSR